MASDHPKDSNRLDGRQLTLDSSRPSVDDQPSDSHYGASSCTSDTNVRQQSGVVGILRDRFLVILVLLDLFF